jgi:hypothetical protein
MVKFVPPDLAPVPNESRGHEYRGRNVVALQQGFGVVEVVGVTVVESDDHRPVW